MFQSSRHLNGEGSLRRSVQQTPYGRPSIAFRCVRAEWVAGLEGKVLLDAMNGRKIVILELAQLQEASKQLFLVSGSAQDSQGTGGTYLSHALGASSTNRSMTISPREVSKSALMADV